jgi:seryl-tRNA synthetase
LQKEGRICDLELCVATAEQETERIVQFKTQEANKKIIALSTELQAQQQGFDDKTQSNKQLSEKIARLQRELQMGRREEHAAREEPAQVESLKKELHAKEKAIQAMLRDLELARRKCTENFQTDLTARRIPSYCRHLRTSTSKQRSGGIIGGADSTRCCAVEGLSCEAVRCSIKHRDNAGSGGYGLRDIPG